MKVQTTIQKWGNSLAIRITGPLKTIPHFTANQAIEIDISENELRVYPLIPKKNQLLRYKESQLLKGLTAEKAHADELADIYASEFDHHE